MLGERGNWRKKRDVGEEVRHRVETTDEWVLLLTKLILDLLHQHSTQTISRWVECLVNHHGHILSTFVHVVPVSKHLRDDRHLLDRAGQPKCSDDARGLRSSDKSECTSRGQVSKRKHDAQESIPSSGESAQFPAASMKRLIPEGRHNLVHSSDHLLVQRPTEHRIKVSDSVDR